MNMQQVWAWCCVASISLCWIAPSYAQCKQAESHKECGGTRTYASVPTHPGCEVLEVTIHNETNYKLAVDKSYQPSKTIGITTGFADVPANSVQTFSISGVQITQNGVADSQHADEVDTSVRYIAKQKNDANTGAQLVLNLVKSSCNSSSPELIKYDYKCYTACRVCNIDHCHWSCTLGGTVPACNLCDYGHGVEVCYSNYKYDHVNCNYASTVPVTNLSSASSVTTPTSGLYTLGTTFNDNGSSTGVNKDSKYSTFSMFYCDQNSECGTNGSCNGGTDDHNKTAKLEFYVYPSPIETLTVTFPFNAQSPIGKIMRDVIYNNLDTGAIASLGTFYSLNPVSIQNTSIAFSTLCDANTCPKP